MAPLNDLMCFGFALHLLLKLIITLYQLFESIIDWNDLASK